MQIADIAKGLGSNDYEILFNALKWLRDNLADKESSAEGWAAEWRKRSAQQIIDSGYAWGCTDYALIFIALMNTAGVEATYIEGVSSKTLEKIAIGGVKGQFAGHVFSRVTLPQYKVIVDPTNGHIFWSKDLPVRGIQANSNFSLGEGKNFTELGFDSVDADFRAAAGLIGENLQQVL